MMIIQEIQAIIKVVIVLMDAFVALACLATTVADGTKRELRIVDLFIAFGMIANIAIIVGAI